MTAVAELAVSNICWSDGQRAQEVAIDTLAVNGVHAIDVAPGKAFPEMAVYGPDSIDRDELVAFRRTLRSKHDSYTGMMRIAGFQAVTFGRAENIFSEDAQEVEALADHMRGIIRLAEFVGAQAIVYGSGGTRLTAGLSEAQIAERAAAFFVPLGEEACEAGVVLGIEPVSTTWTKGQPIFGRTGAEVVDFAAGLARDYSAGNIKFVPDSFALHDGNDSIAEEVMTAELRNVLAPHAQISEPGMAAHSPESPIGATHEKLDKALRGCLVSLASDRSRGGGPMPTLAIEMFAPKTEDGTALPMNNLQFVLSSVIGAARHNYARTLRGN